MDETNTKTYEIGFLGTRDEAAQIVMEAAKNAAGIVTFEGPVDRIQLAYPIQKERGAYFGYCHIECVPGRLREIRDALGANAAILRFLIVTPPPVRQRPRSVPRPRKPAREEYVVPHEPPAPGPLSNEALEKKIEEILQ